MHLFSVILDRLSSLIREEDGQDGIEYMLVVGGVSVGIILAMVAVPGAIPAIVTGMCSAIATIPGFGGVSC
jgi:Flp pilus assembly pilin Flp